MSPGPNRKIAGEGNRFVFSNELEFDFVRFGFDELNHTLRFTTHNQRRFSERFIDVDGELEGPRRKEQSVLHGDRSSLHKVVTMPFPLFGSFIRGQQRISEKSQFDEFLELCGKERPLLDLLLDRRDHNPVLGYSM